MGDIAPVGLIGGTGFYKAAEEQSELEVYDVVKVDTPFGEPSDPLPWLGVGTAATASASAAAGSAGR